MKIIYLTFLAGVALVAPLRAETSLSGLEKMSPQEFSQMLDRNLGEAKTELVPELTPAPVQPVPATSKPVAAQKANATRAGSGYVVLIVLGIVLIIYFFPSIIGSSKRNAGAIFILNLFTGWSFIGWVIALVWACTVSDSDPVPKPLPQLPTKNRDPRGFWEKWRMDDF
jgi:hypothetical protein